LCYLKDCDASNATYSEFYVVSKILLLFGIDEFATNAKSLDYAELNPGQPLLLESLNARQQFHFHLHLLKDLSIQLMFRQVLQGFHL
jgi:hypothetical protein